MTIKIKMISFNNKLISQSIFIGLFFFILSCQNKFKEDTKISAEQYEIPPPPPGIDTSKTLKEKELFAYISTAKTIKPNPENGIPFDKLDYDKIIAYDFKGNGDMISVIDEKGKFAPLILKQKFLKQEQADKILSTLTKKSTYGEGTAACFQPHLGLVFFKENKKINQINICLDCNYLISDIPIPAETHKKINAGSEDEYTLTGFTKSGKMAIITLCKELNFEYGFDY